MAKRADANYARDPNCWNNSCQDPVVNDNGRQFYIDTGFNGRQNIVPFNPADYGGGHPGFDWRGPGNDPSPEPSPREYRPSPGAARGLSPVLVQFPGVGKRRAA